MEPFNNFIQQIYQVNETFVKLVLYKMGSD